MIRQTGGPRTMLALLACACCVLIAQSRAGAAELSAAAATEAAELAESPLATDALTASPDRFRLLLENEHVRVLEYTLRPGERDRWHTHPPKVSYVVRGGRLRIHLADGSSFDADERTGTATWMEFLPRHQAENVGTTPVTIVLTEVKSADPSAAVAEEARVVTALGEFFSAAAAGDGARFGAAVARDFEAIELGRRLSANELFAAIARRRAEGAAYFWRVTEPRVHVDGRTAWVAYTNRGSITERGRRKEMQWLESAVLQNDAGTWRLRLLHSTRVDPPARATR